MFVLADVSHCRRAVKAHIHTQYKLGHILDPPLPAYTSPSVNTGLLLKKEAIWVNTLQSRSYLGLLSCPECYLKKRFWMIYCPKQLLLNFHLMLVLPKSSFHFIHSFVVPSTEARSPRWEVYLIYYSNV